MAVELEKTRIVRLWRLLRTLLDHPHTGLSQQSVLEIVGAGRTTLWRDLKVLEEAGVALDRLTVNGERFIRIPPTQLPRLMLLARHVEALEVARRMLSPLEGTTLLDTFDDILSRFGRPIRRPELSPEELATVALRREVEKAFRRGVRLRIDYINVGQSVSRVREIEPLSWQFVRDEIYLLAIDCEKGERRSYASTRMRGVEVLDRPAAHAPSPPDAPWFTMPDDLDSLKTEDVEIRLGPVCAAQLASHPLHATQVVHHDADGTVRLTARVAGLWSTAEWIALWGPEVCPLGPPALVEMVRARALACVAAWGAGA